MGRQEIDIKIREWLGTEEAQTVLDRLAREISTSVLSRKLSLAFLMKDVFGDYTQDDLHHDIRSELTLFIAEHSSGFSEILTSENRNPHPFLKRAFINYWISKTRSPGTDRQRHLYKRIQDILRDSNEFHTISKARKSTAFSKTADNREIPQLSAEDLSEIAFPIEKLDYESVNKKGVLLHLAAHFCERVSDIWGKIPVWIDTRDFVAWIGLHISLKGPLLQKEDSEGASLIDELPDRTQSPDALYYAPDLVKDWAKKFSNHLKAKEKAVFSLRYGTDLKLKDIARELGYKGSSGPKYMIECIEGKLRFFLADLPWLSPDDFRRDAFRLFIDTILFVLNNAPKKP